MKAGRAKRAQSIGAPATREILRFCFVGDWHSSLAGRVAVLFAWGLTLAILFFNALFPLLLEDGNLLIRGVCTLVMSAPLLYLYKRGKRSVLGRGDAA